MLNIFLPVTPFLGNTLILASLHKESSLHPSSKLLLRQQLISGLLLFCGLSLFYNECLEYLPLQICCEFYEWLYDGVCVSVDTDCSNRKQTSCSLARAQGWINCHFELNIRACNWLLEVAWPSGWSAGLVIRRSKVQIPVQFNQLVFVLVSWVISTVATIPYFCHYLIILW